MNTIFLTYANNAESPLNTLSREDEQIYGILVNRYLKGHYIIHRSSNASQESMVRDLEKFEDHIAIFLFSGHAGRDALNLVDGTANSTGIASYLKKSVEKGKLELVILNGCSTTGQVQKLLELGVPAVIATSAPVEDKSATEFSISLFKNLVDKNLSLKESFDAAIKAMLLTNTQNLDEKNIHRGILPRLDKEESLWGLFVQNESVWDSYPIPSGNQKTKTNYVPNQFLTESLFNTLVAAENTKLKLLSEFERQGEYISSDEKNKAIIEVLPFPISTHLRRLISPVETETEGWDKIGTRRLEQIGLVYHTSLKFLSFLMLAQLWEFKQEKIIDTIPEDLRREIRNYFYLSTEERIQFDHLQFIRLLRKYYEENNIGEATYFVKELETLRQFSAPGNSFGDACVYLGNLQTQAINHKIQEDLIADLCEKAERKLCIFFEHLGFLHKYILASVDNIEVRKYRHQRVPNYGHEICSLMRASGTRETIIYSLPEPLDNKGVILLTGDFIYNREKKQFEGKIIRFLNLTPFLIDINAFEQKTDLYNLFFFDDFSINQKESNFQKISKSINEKEFIKIQPNNAYTLFFEQLQAFRSEMLSEL